jgi:hypothetical protein
MGCNRTPDSPEAKVIKEAAQRVASSTGADQARVEELVSRVGESEARRIIAEERAQLAMAFQQASTFGGSGDSSMSSPTANTVQPFETPNWRGLSSSEPSSPAFSSPSPSANPISPGSSVEPAPPPPEPSRVPESPPNPAPAEAPAAKSEPGRESESTSTNPNSEEGARIPPTAPPAVEARFGIEGFKAWEPKSSASEQPLGHEFRFDPKSSKPMDPMMTHVEGVPFVDVSRRDAVGNVRIKGRAWRSPEGTVCHEIEIPTRAYRERHFPDDFDEKGNLNRAGMTGEDKKEDILLTKEGEDRAHSIAVQFGILSEFGVLYASRKTNVGYQKRIEDFISEVRAKVPDEVKIILRTETECREDPVTRESIFQSETYRLTMVGPSGKSVECFEVSVEMQDGSPEVEIISNDERLDELLAGINARHDRGSAG